MKRWYKSKTLWINALTLLLLVLGTVSNWQEMQQYSTHIAYASALVNVVLRFITTEKLQ